VTPVQALSAAVEASEVHDEAVIDTLTELAEGKHTTLQLHSYIS